MSSRVRVGFQRVRLDEFAIWRPYFFCSWSLELIQMVLDESEMSHLDAALLVEVNASEVRVI